MVFCLYFRCEVIICAEDERQEILEKSKGCDGIIWATHCSLDAEALDAAGPQLKAVSTVSAGYDYVDVPEMKRRGVLLGHTPNVLSNAVADLAVGLLVGAARRFTEGQRKIVNNAWELGDPTWMLGQDIQQSTVGIVGLGGIGQTIIKRLSGFDVGQFLYSGRTKKPAGNSQWDILCTEVPECQFWLGCFSLFVFSAQALGAEYVSLDELLRRSDFVVVACPLTAETRGMFNRAAFAKMKSNCVFVNVARGGMLIKQHKQNALRTKFISIFFLCTFCRYCCASRPRWSATERYHICGGLGCDDTRTIASWSSIDETRQLWLVYFSIFCFRLLFCMHYVCMSVPLITYIKAF